MGHHTTPTLHNAAAEAVRWIGRSGRQYWLRPVPVSDLRVGDTTISVLAMTDGAGERVTWCGTAFELIEDPATRNLFRSALGRASAAYQIASPRDDAERLAMVWDLERATRAPNKNVA
jgi:hypothetical protein